jgi:hypothetical protein
MDQYHLYHPRHIDRFVRIFRKKNRHHREMPAVFRGIFGTIGVQKISAANDRLQSVDLENEADLPLEPLLGCVTDFIRCHGAILA